MKVAVNALKRLSVSYVKCGITIICFRFICGLGFVVGAATAAIALSICTHLANLSAHSKVVGELADTNTIHTDRLFETFGEWLGVIVSGYFAWIASKRIAKVIFDIHQGFFIASLAAFLLLSVFTVWTHVSHDLQLMLDGDSTIGQIVELHGVEHGTIRYKFSVNGTIFYKNGTPDGFEKLLNNDSVKVYYVRSDPNISILRKPRLTIFDNLFNRPYRT